MCDNELEINTELTGQTWTVQIDSNTWTFEYMNKTKTQGSPFIIVYKLQRHISGWNLVIHVYITDSLLIQCGP